MIIAFHIYHQAKAFYRSRDEKYIVRPIDMIARTLDGMMQSDLQEHFEIPLGLRKSWELNSEKVLRVILQGVKKQEIVEPFWRNEGVRSRASNTEAPPG